MNGEVLALVVEDEKSGYLVIDSRCGRPVSWCGDLGDANAVAAYLNSSYPMGADHLSSGNDTAPATDTLIYELVERRIGGKDPMSIETWWMLNQLKTACPWGVPTGPGWDHLYEEARR